MFVNFIAFLLYYKVYTLLVSKDLLSRYSPKDIIFHLARVNKINIGDNGQIAEITKKSLIFNKKIEIDIQST